MEDLTDSRPGRETVPIPPPDQRAAGRTEKFVTFRLGEGSFAILASAVSEITHPLPLTALPLSVPGLLGISPLRGEILAVLDIRHVVGEANARALDPRSKQIVLKRGGPDAAAISFAVDRIGEIAALDLSRVRPVAGASETIIGEADINGGAIKVIDHSGLASAVKID